MKKEKLAELSETELLVKILVEFGKFNCINSINNESIRDWGRLGNSLEA